MTRIIQALFMALALAVPGWAHAISHTFCFTYTVAYEDGATGDFFDPSVYAARGATFRIIRNSNSDTFDFTLLESNGCKTINLNAEAWTVKLLRTAEVNGNTVEVRSHIDDGLFLTTVETSWVPDGGTDVWTIGDGTVGNINIMAVATYAIYTENGGMTGKTYSFRNDVDPCPTAAGCWAVTTNTINIGSSLFDRKFGILHELGHAMSDKVNGSQGLNADCDAPPNACEGVGDSSGDGHYPDTKEFQSCAAIEGIAWAYAAVVFNDTSTSPCEFQTHFEPDWDQDDVNDAAEVEVFGCEGQPITGELGADYLGDRCLGSGATTNRGNEFDWIRHYWDLRTDGPFAWSTLLAQWALADAHDWTANGTGSGGNFPAERLHDAAFWVGIQATYDSFGSFNGVDR